MSNLVRVFHQKNHYIREVITQIEGLKHIYMTRVLAVTLTKATVIDNFWSHVKNLGLL